MKSRILKSIMIAVASVSLIAMPGVALGQPGPVLPADPSDNIVELDLYNLTDVHGHIEQVKHYKSGKIIEAGLPAVGCYLAKARSAHQDSSFTLLGDNIGASPFTTGILYDNPTIAALNKLQPVASTIGNHELDLGQDVFKARVKGGKATVNGEEIQFEKIGFPYLGANVTGLGDALGDYTVWTAPESGVKVAFIGAIAEDVPYKLSPGITAGMEFKDPIPLLNDQAKQLKEAGKADVVIAMLDDDVKNNYPKMGSYIDGLMGGDTHVPYEFTMVDGSQGNKLSATASGSYTDNLSNLKIKYNKTTGKVHSSSVTLIPAAEVAQCSEDPYGIQPIVDKAKADSEVAGKKVVASGITATFSRAIHETSEGPQGAGSNRGHESSLGDLVADSIHETVLTKEGKPVDIGIINAGGLRADLQPQDDGTITYAQTYAVQPFGNELGYVTITGKDFKDALEQQWKTNLTSQNSRPMLKLGISKNVTYTYDPAKRYGERITSVLINGEPMDMAKNYTVGSVTFLLAGGDSFDALTRHGDATTFGNLDRDQFNDYLMKNPGIEPRMTKSSVGVTLPAAPVKEGDNSASIQFRGLSFTEGPYVQPEKTLVTIGGVETELAHLNTSLVDDNAESEEKAIITTDGAGQGAVTIPTQAICQDKSGEVVNAPVAVTHIFAGDKRADVVTPAHGLIVSIQCATHKPAKPTETPTVTPTTGAGDGSSATPMKPAAGDGSSATPKKPAAAKHLAQTGSNAVGLGAVVLLLVAIGSALVYARRMRSRRQ